MKVKFTNLLSTEADIRLIQVGPTAQFPTLETGTDYPFTDIGGPGAIIEAGIRLSPAINIDCSQSLSFIENLKLKGTFKISVNGLESPDYLTIEEIGTFVSENFGLQLIISNTSADNTYTVGFTISANPGTYRIHLIPSPGSTINNATSTGSFSYLDANGELFFCIKLVDEPLGDQSNGCAVGVGIIKLFGEGETNFNVDAYVDDLEPVRFESFKALKAYLEEHGFTVSLDVLPE